MLAYTIFGQKSVSQVYSLFVDTVYFKLKQNIRSNKHVVITNKLLLIYINTVIIFMDNLYCGWWQCDVPWLLVTVTDCRCPVARPSLFTAITLSCTDVSPINLDRLDRATSVDTDAGSTTTLTVGHASRAAVDVGVVTAHATTM